MQRNTTEQNEHNEWNGTERNGMGRMEQNGGEGKGMEGKLRERKGRDGKEEVHDIGKLEDDTSRGQLLQISPE